MRPDVLNPLFTEVEAMKGVGPGMAKPLAKLGLARAIDVLFHLPTGTVTRHRIERLDDAAPGEMIGVVVTPVEYKQRGPRGPLRIHAVDAVGDYVSLIYFGNAPAYAKKLFPLGEAKLVSGRLDLYGEERQIVHPDQVLAPGDPLALRESIYPLSDGLTSKRLGQLAEQVLARAPDLSEWIEPGLSLFTAVRHLERIADHTTNIAEDVIFWVRGADVRHNMSADQPERDAT